MMPFERAQIMSYMGLPGPPTDTTLERRRMSSPHPAHEFDHPFCSRERWMRGVSTKTWGTRSHPVVLGITRYYWV